jgi:hypothetical protein
MTTDWWRWLAASTGLAIAYPSVAAAQPDDLAQWDLICYCSTTVSTPHFAVRTDSNGRILYHARRGATRAELERELGTRVSLSQLELLRAWRLVKRQGDVYTTTIPILGPDKIGRLRADMRRIASDLAPAIEPDILAIAAALNRRKLGRHLYAVVFSYVIDGLTWDQLGSDGAVPDLQSTAERPFWDGTFWAVFPKRESAPGTNSTSGDSVRLLMTWTDRVLPGLKPLQSAPDLRRALHRIGAGDCRDLLVEDASHASWPLGAPDGSCAVPVIHANPTDSVHAAGTRIAAMLARAVLARDERQVIGGDVTAQQAHLIETHELIWELLDALTSRGIVEAPLVLQRDGPSPTPNVLLPLLVIAIE